MALDIDVLRKLCKDGNIKWTMHIFKRMRERDISSDEVLECIEFGEIIEQYQQTYSSPSCLVLHIGTVRPLHVVAACDGACVYLVTAYVPTLDEWEADYRTRKEGRN